MRPAAARRTSCSSSKRRRCRLRPWLSLRLRRWWTPRRRRSSANPRIATAVSRARSGAGDGCRRAHRAEPPADTHVRQELGALHEREPRREPPRPATRGERVRKSSSTSSRREGSRASSARSRRERRGVRARAGRRARLRGRRRRPGTATTSAPPGPRPAAPAARAVVSDERAALERRMPRVEGSARRHDRHRRVLRPAAARAQLGQRRRRRREYPVGPPRGSRRGEQRARADEHDVRAGAEQRHHEPVGRAVVREQERSTAAPPGSTRRRRATRRSS